MFLHRLTQRQRQPEIIDEADLDARLHAQALRGLERINWWSASAGMLWRPLRDLARTAGPLRVLDLATGAGDVPLRLWHTARRTGLNLQVDGCDRSPQAVEYARRRAAEQGADVHFFTTDATQGELPPDYDAIVCSLFLHHLDEDQAVALLARMGRAARRLILVNDLARSRTGFALAYLGTRVLTRSAVVHADGPRSVEGAFTLAEARALAARAGLEGATVSWRWPCRFLLAWQRTGGICPSGEAAVSGGGFQNRGG
jgi:SAM-dependent methyltransferase